ncbi:MAG: LysR family transcriptional regulator [Alphaproteobacteria bacterium]|jgi:DNA-binding transcriptional LysR family regulator|nr:LysR family transcriptional regulator [Alphaproteobacteria bacterium]MBT7943322.1 LysR family transcriptional regulator [Alphaproteobacteria bacterium]
MDSQSEMAVFVRVAETGNFSASARALKLTPSAVSKLIGRLEDRLGARLLHRTTRRVSLTEEGRTFYQHCTPILAAIDEAEQAITQLHGEPRGLLKVNASTYFAREHIEPLIPDFLARYPELRIQLTLSEQFVDLIEEEVDVAIRIGQLPDSTLIARKLGSAQRMVVGSPSYLALHGTPRNPDELKDHNCIILSTATSLNQWEFKGPDGPRRIEVRGNFETNNAVALHNAALGGIGLVRAGNFTVAKDIRAGRLVTVLADFEATTQTNVYAVYPHNRHLSPKVRVFVDMLVDAFLPVAPWEQAG